MRAIILAAGRGSRMEHYTEQLPKCMVQLNNRPLLDYQVQAIRSAGIQQIGIVCGYAKEKINHNDITHKFENPIWQTSNMVRSLLSASQWLQEEDCIVSYSDIFYDLEAVRSLMCCADNIVITYDSNFLKLWSKRFSNPLSDLETFQLDKDNNLKEIGSRANSLEEIQGQYMGLLKFTPEGWREVLSLLLEFNNEQINKLDMTSLLKLLLKAQIKIHAVPFSGKWGEVDHPSDLVLYESWFE